MFQRVISIGLLAFFALPASAVVLDRHMAESQKCGRVFFHFERKHRIPVNTLHSISLKESGRIHPQHKLKIVWPWTVNVEGEGYFFETKREAVLFTEKQLLSGKKSIDVGCMQINLKHHPDAFPSLEHAFDPRKNVDYGAKFLRLKYEQLGDWHKAIAHYHSATDALGSRYKQDVIKIASQMNQYKDSLKQHVGRSKISHQRVFIDQHYAAKIQKTQERNRIYAEQRKALYNSRSGKYRSPMMVRVPRS